jgi:hypothetical protein
MKISMLTNEYPPYVYGGAGVHVEYLTRELAALDGGHHICPGVVFRGITRDVVRRILAVRYRPAPASAGPSWLTVLGHTKDSLWSLDLSRCESAVLRSHWALVVMDQCTRRIVGLTAHRASWMAGAVPHVQSRDSRPIHAQISQLGP